jgi:hypothetical protein
MEDAGALRVDQLSGRNTLSMRGDGVENGAVQALVRLRDFNSTAHGLAPTISAPHPGKYALDNPTPMGFLRFVLKNGTTLLLPLLLSS